MWDSITIGRDEPEEARVVKTIRLVLVAVLLAAAQTGTSATLSLTLPQPATEIGGRVENPASYLVPTGAFAAGTASADRVTGALTQHAYRLDGSKLNTLEIMTALRLQVIGAGYVLVYECDTAACGGFDFRFALDVLPEPQMHVDLGDFRYLAATRAGGAEAVTLLVSRSADQGFVQVTTVDAAGKAPEVQAPSALPADPAPAVIPDQSSAGSPQAPLSPDPASPGSLGDRLTRDGSVALEDLIFPTGASALEDKDYASLTDLTAWLAANPVRKVVLVGHTDASGSLGSNVALSKQRAQSVRAWLIQHYGAAPARIDAQGAGYLAPRDTNLTDTGRTRNRRVEVVLTSTQ